MFSYMRYIYKAMLFYIDLCDGCDDVTCLSMLCWSSSAYNRAGGGTPGGGAMYIRGGVNDVGEIWGFLKRDWEEIEC